MKIKLDENLDPQFSSLLVAEGHDADTVIDEGISGFSDKEVYDVCLASKRVLITLDLDFSNPFHFPPEKASGIIVLRPARPSLPLIKSLFLALLPALRSKSFEGKLWIVEQGRIREYETSAEK
jgi:predicted nuclease of predicted toxin-antitoxin system